MLHVTRLGFCAVRGRELYDGPEEPLQEALRHMERNGHEVVGVSVGRSTRGGERYEAFVVTRGPTLPPPPRDRG